LRLHSNYQQGKGCNLKKVILIIGSPCVGKTTVSKQLANKLNALHIDLNELAIKEKLTVGTDNERDTLIADDAKLSRRVHQIIRQKGQVQNIIIDGHYATDVVPIEKITKVFVLRRNPKELEKLMRKRGYKGRKIGENLAAEILDICLDDALKSVSVGKVCEIDVTGKGTAEVANEVVSILNNSKPCTVGIVDWLGKLEQEKSLDAFLKEFQ
jgi:adenylate kinase